MVSPKKQSKKEFQARQQHSKRFQVNRKRRVQRRSLVRTIKDLKSLFALPPFASCDVQQSEPSGHASVKAVIICLNEIPEQVQSLLETAPKSYIEMECTSKTLKNLYFYLNFYRQSTDAVHPLQELSNSMTRTEQKTIQLIAFCTELLEPAIANTILNNLSSEEHIYITTDPLEVFDLERLLFVKSSRELILNGDIRCFKTAFGLLALVRLLKLKKWLLENFSDEDRNRFILIGSTVLFSFGIRAPNDIDLYVYRDIEDKAFLKRFKDALNTIPKELLSCTDILVRGHGRWSDRRWLDRKRSPDFIKRAIFQYTYEWPNSFGAESMIDVINNPQFHHYFLGLKCISLQAEIERRVQRIRPSAYADLFYMQSLSRIADNYPITIPRLTECIYSVKKKDWIRLEEKDRDKYFARIQKYHKSKYGKPISDENGQPISDKKIKEKIVKGSDVKPFNYSSIVVSDPQLKD